MSTEKDLLETLSSLDRVFYATGVLLNADDFKAEQTYHRGRLARALAYLHGSGTVAGLKVEYLAVPGQDEQIVVNPGIALDRIGRVIEMPRRTCIRLDRWYQAQDADLLVQALHPRILHPVADDPYHGVVVDLFLRFMVCERGKTPAFAAGPFEALDPVVPSRLHEGYRLELILRPEDRPPLPQNNWPDLAAIPDPQARREALQEAIFNLWPKDTGAAENNPEPVDEQNSEYVATQDRTSVFLARMEIPASPPPSPGKAPVRTAGAVTVHNDQRLFVYRARALARGEGL